MKKGHTNEIVGILVLFTLVLVWSNASYAAPVTITLTRTSILTNVDDPAGVWQYDGGEVRLSGTLVAHYARTKRVISGGGTDAQNTAMLTMTIFVLGADPPENVTLQGSHSFNSGVITGSVSAASPGFPVPGAIGVKFHGDDAALTFDLP